MEETGMEREVRRHGPAGPGAVPRAAWDGILRRWRRAALAPPADLVVVEPGDTLLRATRIVRRGDAPPRARTVERTLPPNLDPSERAARERAALVSLVAELEAPGRPAVGALRGSDVLVRRLSLPRLAPRDLRSALELECRKIANVDPGESVIRYEPVEEGRRPGREMPILAAIAPRGRVEAWRSLVAGAGLKPWALTVSAAGLRADLARRRLLDPAAVVAYLDIGRDACQIVVLRGTDLRFSRDLTFGLGALTGALRNIVVPGVGTLERSEAEAEALLREYGIPGGAQEARFAGEVPLAAVSIMLRPILERLVRELWNSFDYCNEQFHGEAVARVVLLGPGGGVPRLADHLAGVLKMPVAAADPYPGAETWSGSAPGAPAPGADAAHVALGSLSRDTIDFLLDDARGSGLRWLADAVPAPAVAAVAALVIASVAAPTQLNLERAKGDVASLRAELSTLSAQSDAIARFRSAREEEARLRALLERLTGSRVVWSAALRDLSHRIGPDVRLTALEVIAPAANEGGPAAPAAAGTAATGAGRLVRFSGLLRSPESSPERALAVLLRSLGSSPVFDEVRLEGCERVTNDQSSFVVTARLAEGSGG